jgi:photosystem II stability/assembly factor-like uncharacterized protein
MRSSAVTQGEIMFRNIRQSIIWSSLIVVLANAATLADDNVWSSNGPYGARVFTIAIHPFNNQIIYIGTIENGIYKSTNGGADWFHLDNNLLTEAMRVIRIHPFGPDTVYASTANGVFKSTDAGATWSRFDPFSSEYRALAIHPMNPAIMIIGGLGMYFKTTDAGNSWSETICNQVVQDVDFDPTDSNRVYRATQSPFTGHSIYRSDDLGDTWQCIHNDLDSLGFVQDMAVDPIDPQTIYLAEHSYLDSIPRCLSKTTNGGQHWLDITPPALHRPYINSVEISPLDHNDVYVCTFSDGVLKSTDGGLSWQRKNDGLKVDRIARLIVDSTTGFLYLGTYFDGIYRSTNGGDNWEKISYHILQAGCINVSVNSRYADSIYATTPAGILRSIDGAQTWEFVDIGLMGTNTTTSNILIDPHPNYIYVGLGEEYYALPRGGFARSTDGGASWEIINTDPIGERSASKLALSCAASSRRIFFASDSGLYYSDDIGLTWSICQGGLPVFDCSGLDVSPVDYNLVFLSRFWPEPSTFYRSTDRGETWNQLDGIPAGGESQFIKCDPLDRDIVYADAGLGVGLYKSTDCGLTWFDANNNLPRDVDFFEVTGLEINPLNNNEILVNSFNKGVFISYDGGGNWNPFSDGLQFLGYGSADIEINPIDTSKIIMSTFGASVWSIHRTLNGIEENAPVLPEKITLSSYPNPFNSSTKISFVLPKEEHFTLNLYDITGRKIATISEATYPAGSHSLNLSLKDHASGIYYLVLNTENTHITRKMVMIK